MGTAHMGTGVERSKGQVIDFQVVAGTDSVLGMTAPMTQVPLVAGTGTWV